jgi:hypothetical protein
MHVMVVLISELPACSACGASKVDLFPKSSSGFHNNHGTTPRTTIAKKVRYENE